MERDDFLEWFEEIANRNIGTFRGTYGLQMERAKIQRWITDASSALEAVFPKRHPVLRHWHEQAREYDRNPTWFECTKAVFNSGLEQLKNRRLETLAETVRRDSEIDLLDQASTLADEKFAAAAAVIAGGALEMHLLQLCEKHGLTWSGPGSIAKYNTALYASGKAGDIDYTKTDMKDVEAWGAKRNDAAHSPGDFPNDLRSIEIMIESIRLFISKK